MSIGGNYIDGNGEDTEHVFSIYKPFYKSQGFLLCQVGSPVVDMFQGV